MSETNQSKKELYQALAKFQDECPEIQLDQTATVQMKGGGKYSYRFASLPNIHKKIAPVLKDCGLVVFHQCDKETIVTTTVVHIESEKSISSVQKIPTGTTAQSYGASESYSIRYNIRLLFNIIVEEDKDNPPPKEKKKKNLSENDFNLAVERITNGEQGLYEKIKKICSLSKAQDEVLFKLAIKHEAS